MRNRWIESKSPWKTNGEYYMSVFLFGFHFLSLYSKQGLQTGNNTSEHSMGVRKRNALQSPKQRVRHHFIASHGKKVKSNKKRLAGVAALQNRVTALVHSLLTLGGWVETGHLYNYTNSSREHRKWITITKASTISPPKVSFTMLQMNWS